MRGYIGVAWVAGILLGTEQLPAQDVEVTAFATAVTNGEIDRTREAKGLGFGGEVRVGLGRFRLQAAGLTTSLRGEFSVQPDYAMHQLELLASYLWRPYLAVEAGFTRRFVSPDFAAQELGAVRLGVLSEARLSRVAGIWARGALVPAVQYSGGGTSLGFALGLGTRLGTTGGRWQGLAEFSFERLDRKVDLGVGRDKTDAPIRFSSIRVGVGRRL